VNCKLNIKTALAYSIAAWALSGNVAIAQSSSANQCDPYDVSEHGAFVIGIGDGACPAGTRLATIGEVHQSIEQACIAVGNWAAARLACNGALEGRGDCEINLKIPNNQLGHSLCVKTLTASVAPAMPEVAPGVKAFSPILAYSVGNQVRGAEGNAPDYFIGVANGIGITSQNATNFQIARTDTDGAANGAIVVLQIFQGEGLGRYISGFPGGTKIAPQIDDQGVFFRVSSPLEADAGPGFFSLESVDYPDYFLRHHGHKLRLDQIGRESASGHRRDATFATQK
jgi:hypothetical protein